MTEQDVPIRGSRGSKALNGDQNRLLLVISFDSHNSLKASPEPELVSGLCSDHRHLWVVYTGDNVEISFASTPSSHVVLQFVVASLEGDVFSGNLFKIRTGVYVCVSLHLCLGSCWRLMRYGMKLDTCMKATESGPSVLMGFMMHPVIFVFWVVFFCTKCTILLLNV